MKAVVLAGGTGSRLMPSTKITNKHLLPIYDRPMIYYPLDLLGKAGIDEVLIVSGEGHAGDFLELLGDGSDIPTKRKGNQIEFNFDGNITYKLQKEPKGIAQAIGLAEDFIGEDEKFIVILADNIYGEGLTEQIKAFQENNYDSQIFLKEVDDPERFGNPKVEGEKIIDIEEKPDNPYSPYAITGCYGFYNDKENNLFEFIKKDMEVSDRGEYEVTDILNWYLDRGELTYETLEQFWTDAGKPNALMKASKYMEEKLN